MKTKAVGIILAVLLLAGGYYFFQRQKAVSVSTFSECEQAGYPVGESYPRQCWTPDGRNFVEELPGMPGETVTVKGEIACLSKRGNGPQTMECAIGLKSFDGKYYSLKNLSKVDPDYAFSQGGVSVAVTGEFIADAPKGPDGNVYDVVGTIDVRQIEQLLSDQPFPTETP